MENWIIDEKTVIVNGEFYTDIKIVVNSVGDKIKVGKNMKGQTIFFNPKITTMEKEVLTIDEGREERRNKKIRTH